MKESILGFSLWLLCGLFFIAMGVYNFFTKKRKAFGFWANAETFPVENIKAYNRALGKLWIVFGLLFILLGLPLLKGQNSPWILLCILGVMAEAIGAMAVYTLFIEKKYRKK